MVPHEPRRRSSRFAVVAGGLLLLGALLVSLDPARSAEAAARPVRRPVPHAGYAFPAGGQAGTTFRMVVGGQYLRSVTGVRVTGDGVQGKVLLWFPPPRPLDGAQARALRQKLRELRDARLGRTPTTAKAQGNGKAGGGGRPGSGAAEAAKLPDHPLLHDLESKSLDELEEIARFFFTRKNPLERKPAIEETVRLEMTIAADAQPGTRELRLVTRSGITNPVRFQVGLLPERVEHEPLLPGQDDTLEVELPCVLNGQILPGDVDHYRFHAKKGQHLVFRTSARALVPFQADSVPGWMQATLTLRDAGGHEVAYADDYRFDPDPVLRYEVPADGSYVLEVRDAVMRGREDFVYRVEAGELPFVETCFPLGGREGALVNAAVDGWNLSWTRVPLDTNGPPGERAVSWRQGDAVTNEIHVAVGDLPETTETEPNDDPASASPIELPLIVNGRIGKPGDEDCFRFEGKAGEEVVLDVEARSLGSPMDSVVWLLDAGGKVVAWNDDADDADALGFRGLGLQTHHADSRVQTRLPESGAYTVRLADVDGHGGAAYAYRLRVSTPRPDAELFVSPSSVNVPAGRAAEVTLYVVRHDGFDGAVDVSLADAPPGFALDGATIPAGRSRVRATLTAPAAGGTGPRALRLVGRFARGKKTIERSVVPADDLMQAFLWRHLVPAREWDVQVLGGRYGPRVEPATRKVTVVHRGGKEVVSFHVVGRLPLDGLRFQAIDPPKGVTVGKATATKDGISVEIRASAGAEHTSAPDNLIVEILAERTVGAKHEKRLISGGVLPAIPYRID